MIPLLQQGMLCPCKSRMLLPGAVCFSAAVSLAHLGHPVLPCTLADTEACHSFKQTLHFQWTLMLLETVTWSGDME